MPVINALRQSWRQRFPTTGLAAHLLLLFVVATNATLASAPAVAALDRIVAVVNDDIILQSELQQEINRLVDELRERGTGMPPRQVLQRQTLEHLIMERLQLQRARDTGIRVDEAELNDTLKNIAEHNGVTLKEMRDSLNQEPGAFAEFRAQVQKEMVLAQLQRRDILQRIQVSDREVDNFLAAQQLSGGDSQQFHLSHILVSLPEGATKRQVEAAEKKMAGIVERLQQGADFAELALAESDGQQALQGGDLGWRNLGELPVLFADAVRNLQPGELSPVLRSPAGLHLLKVQEIRGVEQHLTEQRHLRHILIRESDSVSSAQARERLEHLRQRIELGEDFAALAQAHSDDPGSAVKGGDLGWVSDGQMVPAFEKAAKALAEGQISQPVHTQFGWHLIQSLGTREQNDTVAYRRQKAREQIRARKADEARENWLRRLRDEAYVEYRLPAVE